MITGQVKPSNKHLEKKMLKLLLFLPPKNLQTDINVISFTLAT